MRAYELYEFDQRALGNYDPGQDRLGQRHLSDIRKNKLTLRIFNRLNKIRTARRLEREKKAPLLKLMYGDDGLQAEQNAIDAEREKFHQEIELTRLELERDKLAIQHEIDAAELDDKQRQHIRAMAMRVLGKK
jgi:hypothetical protein